jgi:hypothetical protein
MRMYGAVDIQFQAFLIWALHDVSGRLRAPAFTPGESASGTYWVVGWVEPRACFDVTAKRQSSAPVGNRILLFSL